MICFIKLWGFVALKNTRYSWFKLVQKHMKNSNISIFKDNHGYLVSLKEQIKKN